jgi:hypothetical protein
VTTVWTRWRISLGNHEEVSYIENEVITQSDAGVLIRNECECARRFEFNFVVVGCD